MNRTFIILTGLGVVAIAAAVFLFTLIFGPGGDGVVAEASLPDGRRFTVVQRWNASMEPYTVSFVYQLEDGRWGWCYMNHQDTRWLSAKVLHIPTHARTHVRKRILGSYICVCHRCSLAC